MTSVSTATTVRFSDLAHHLEEQIRGSTNPATVNRYQRAMQAGEEFPPLVVAEVAGALVLVDGFHRRDALEGLGREDAPAEIVPCGSLKEARWLGFKANLRHGLPLKSKHLRPALSAYIGADMHRAHGRLKSYRGIATDLPGVSHSTIRRWIEKDFPGLFAEMGGEDGEAAGGLHDGAPVPTPEENLVEEARAHIAEARALLQGLPSAMRQRAAAEVEALLVALMWDAEEGVEGA